MTAPKTTIEIVRVNGRDIGLISFPEFWTMAEVNRFTAHWHELTGMEVVPSIGAELTARIGRRVLKIGPFEVYKR